MNYWKRLKNNMNCTKNKLIKKQREIGKEQIKKQREIEKEQREKEIEIEKIQREIDELMEQKLKKTKRKTT